MDWREEFVNEFSGEAVDWRREFANAAFVEGDELNLGYLTIFEGAFPRDMTPDEIKENWQEVSIAKVKEINGLFDLGCFKLWFRIGPIISSTQDGLSFGNGSMVTSE